MHTRFTFFLLFLLLFSFLNQVDAQNRYFEYFNRENGLKTRIDIDTHDVSVESGVQQWKSLGKVNIDGGTFRDIPVTITTNYFYLKDGTIWFTIGGTGQVYNYNPKKQHLTRIDDTYYKGYNFESPQFLRHDTLYSFGGYGFWNFSKVLTYYNLDTRDWELIRPEGESPETIFEGYQGYCPKKDIFYSGESEQQLYIKKEIKKSRGKYLFGYDFKTNTWNKLGLINPSIPTPINGQMCWNGNYFIQMLDNKLFLLDPTNNKVFEFDDGKHFFLAGGPVQSMGDKFFFYRGQEKKISFSVSGMIKKSKYVGPFYITGISYLYLYIILSIVLLIGFGYLVYRRLKNKHKKLDSENIGLDELEWRLIVRLVNKGQDGHLTTQEINTILDLDSKSLENQRRMRVHMIKEINHKIKLHYNIDDAIERSDSDEDKRLNIYRLKRQAITVFSNLLKNQ